MTTQEILQLLDEKRVLTAPAAVAWDEVQRQQNRLNKAAKRLNGPITVTLALNLLFCFYDFSLRTKSPDARFSTNARIDGWVDCDQIFCICSPSQASSCQCPGSL